MLECLEDRMVLSTINWINRGQAADNFAAVFGANANTARSVVDAGIREWATVIGNFHQANHGDNNHIDVSISMNTDNNSNGAVTNLTSTDGNGKPLAATISIGRYGFVDAPNNRRDPWYLNPTLFASAYLGTPTNAYAGYAQAGSPAAGQWDLLEVITHELGHAMGFSGTPQVAAHSTDTGQLDTDGDGQGHLFRFDGTNGFTALLTTANGSGHNSLPLHFALPGTSATVGGVSYFGADDLMTRAYGQSQRRIISLMDVNVLRDSYGYTVSDPADALGNFYVVQDETGKLTVRGGPQGANFDNINVGVQTTGIPVIPTVFAQVVVRNPAPGTTFPFSFAVYHNFANVKPLNAVNAIALTGGGSTVFVDVDTANSTGRSPAPVSITNTGQLNVNILTSGGAVAILGAGPSTVRLGNAINGVRGILGGVNIQNSVDSSTAVTVDDSADPSARTVILYNNGPANGSYNVVDGLPTGADIVLRGSQLSSLTVRAGSGGNTFRIHDTPSSLTTVSTGGGNDLVTVDGTTGPLSLDGAGGSDTVNIGTGTLQTIRSSVTVTNSGGHSAVNVDDSGDKSARTVILYNNGPANGSYTVIDGLPSGGDIVLRGPELSSLAVRAGSGGNTFRIHDTPSSLATVSTGGGDDLVTVDGTTGPLQLDGAGGSDTVNIGTGSLQTIRSSVTVTDSGGHSAVTVDDSADPSARTVLLYNNGPANGSYTVVDGLPSGGDIVLRGPELSSLAVRAGSGGNTFRIHDTPLSNTPGGLMTTVSTGTGSNMVTVDGTTGAITLVAQGAADNVFIGTVANPLDHLRGPLTVNGQGGTSLNINDQGSSSGKFYEIYANTVKRVLNAAPKSYDAVINYANISNVSVSGGSGDDNFFVLGTAAGTTTTLNGGAGFDSFILGGDGSGQVSGIAGPLRLDGQEGSGRIWVNDFGGVDGRTFTLNGSTLSWGDVSVVAANVVTFEVTGGQGDDTYRVLATDGTFIWSLDNAGGTNTLIGPDTPNIWNLTAGAAYSYLRADVGFRADLIQNLVGGADADTFVFSDGFQTAGSIDGGGGVNTLDYSAYTSSVLVNLQTSTATGIGGGIANIQNVIGQNNGPAGTYNILVGNGGNVLTGGSGRRNLLIAGGSASQLFGGNDDDILIGGTTAYDTEADLASLQAIMAYWTSADDYTTRVSNLTTGNGVPLLDATTVHSNGGGNTLSGGGGLDLFFGRLGLDNHDKQDGEVFIEV